MDNREIDNQEQDKDNNNKLTIEDIKKMTSKQINQNWDAVKEVLENIQE